MNLDTVQQKLQTRGQVKWHRNRCRSLEHCFSEWCRPWR